MPDRWRPTIGSTIPNRAEAEFLVRCAILSTCLAFLQTLRPSRYTLARWRRTTDTIFRNRGDHDSHITSGGIAIFRPARTGWPSRFHEFSTPASSLMLILGLNMFHADASAAIIQDGEVIFAIAEERLNRIKHYAGFPSLAIKACLDAAGAKMTDVDHVAVGQDSDANLARKVQYALANPAKILNFIRLRQHKEAMRDVRSLIATSLDVDPAQLRFQEHHLEHHIAHIASAYYCSPWEIAAGFSYDGSGYFVSTMMARCEGKTIEILDRVFLPHSLGGFYTMICEFIGYKKYGDEGKVMGLAPYGKETYCEQIRHILDLNGSLALNLSYFKPLGWREVVR